MPQSLAVNHATKPHSWENITIAATFSAIAPLFAILTWQPYYTRTAMRDLSLPVLAGELLIIVFLLSKSPSIGDKLRTVSPTTLSIFSIWFVCAATSTFLAYADPGAARYHFIITATHIAFGFLMWSRLASSARLPNILLPSLAFSLAAYTIIAVGLSLTVDNNEEFDWLSFGAGVTNVRHLGFYGLGLTGLATGLWAFGQNILPRHVCAILLGIGLFLVFWSGSRAAFGAMICQFIAVLMALPKAERSKFLLLIMGLSMVAIPLSIWLAPAVYYGANVIFGRISSVTGDAGNSFSSGRYEIWLETIPAILKQPWFGYGEAQFKTVVTTAGNYYNTPHSYPLQILFQWGVLGTAPFCLLIFRLLTPIKRMMFSQQADVATAYIVLVGLTAMSMLDGPYFYPYPIMLAVMSIAIITASNSSANTTASSGGSAQVAEIRI